ALTVSFECPSQPPHRVLRRPIESATGIPCATVFTLIRSLPGAPGLLATITTRHMSAIAA
ncbi:hypothetical protein, partial [Bradyrhizobium sp. SZCCHNS3052]|uniref:hypothetical protein n=1 Tax=Bradyrhizobium sp. SZCCHNS3052 TaxID=3057321 RepID=UPI00291603C8